MSHSLSCNTSQLLVAFYTCTFTTFRRKKQQQKKQLQTQHPAPKSHIQRGEEGGHKRRGKEHVEEKESTGAERGRTCPPPPSLRNTHLEPSRPTPRPDAQQQQQTRFERGGNNSMGHRPCDDTSHHVPCHAAAAVPLRTCPPRRHAQPCSMRAHNMPGEEVSSVDITRQHTYAPAPPPPLKPSVATCTAPGPAALDAQAHEDAGKKQTAERAGGITQPTTHLHRRHRRARPPSRPPGRRGQRRARIPAAGG